MPFSDYEGFKKSIFQMTSIDLNAYKEKQMRRRIDTLINKHGYNGYNEYIKILKSDKKLFEEFVSYLTINVSEFYRNPEQWKVLDTVVIPSLVQRFGKNLKIWSAACSTGDEPYSLVMALSNHIPLNQIKIVATDIDKHVLEKARVGLYSEKSIEAVPKHFKDKYFNKIGASYQIRDEIKERVEFKQHNLLKDMYDKNIDLLVCRNVLIYFTEEAKDEIFKKFSESIKPGGYLFIGSTEQIISYRDIKFNRANSFFYEKDK